MDNQLDTSDTAALSTILRPTPIPLSLTRSHRQRPSPTHSALHLISSRREVPSIDSPKSTSRTQLRRKPSTIGCCVSRSGETCFSCQLVAQPLAHAHVSIAIVLTPRHAKQTVIRHHPDCSSRCVGQAEDRGNMRHAAGHEDSERANDADSVHHTHCRGEGDKLDVFGGSQKSERSDKSEPCVDCVGGTGREFDCSLSTVPSVVFHSDPSASPSKLNALHTSKLTRTTSMLDNAPSVSTITSTPRLAECEDLMEYSVLSILYESSIIRSLSRAAVQLNQSFLQKPPKVKRTAPNSTPISFTMSTSSGSHPTLSTLSDLERCSTKKQADLLQNEALLRSLIHQQEHVQFHSDAILVARHNCDPTVRHATHQPVHTTRFEGVRDAAPSVARFLSARDLGIVQPLQHATIADRLSVSVDVVQLAESSANVELLTTSCFSTPPSASHLPLPFPPALIRLPLSTLLTLSFSDQIAVLRHLNPTQDRAAISATTSPSSEQKRDFTSPSSASSGTDINRRLSSRSPKSASTASSRLESVEELNEEPKTADERFRSSDELRQDSALPASMYVADELATVHVETSPRSSTEDHPPSVHLTHNIVAVRRHIRQWNDSCCVSVTLPKENPVVVEHRYRYRLSLHSVFIPHNHATFDSTDFVHSETEQTAATTQSLFIDVSIISSKGQHTNAITANPNRDDYILILFRVVPCRLLVRIRRRRIHTNLFLGVICQTMTSRSRAGKNEQQIRAEHEELSAQKMIKNK
ncbi:hypothetical protein BLNAU_13617 [Blattamonas nauphoetae]|uniref:Uncharacterized protein n=1 Tax=Blattamonas nauphoetae TaxID=2049346 RepID=A0ABQ9XMU9_9EUKA|nr:hypothetical protein BLNAU_13617 [Blattamonas nauphoetae]